jgi:hypothetical protein
MVGSTKSFFAGHANFHGQSIQRIDVIDGIDDKVMTSA